MLLWKSFNAVIHTTLLWPAVRDCMWGERIEKPVVFKAIPFMKFLPCIWKAIWFGVWPWQGVFSTNEWVASFKALWALGRVISRVGNGQTGIQPWVNAYCHIYMDDMTGKKLLWTFGWYLAPPGTDARYISTVNGGDGDSTLASLPGGAKCHSWTLAKRTVCTNFEHTVIAFGYDAKIPI